MMSFVMKCVRCVIYNRSSQLLSSGLMMKVTHAPSHLRWNWKKPSVCIVKTERKGWLFTFSQVFQRNPACLAQEKTNQSTDVEPEDGGSCTEWMGICFKPNVLTEERTVASAVKGYGVSAGKATSVSTANCWSINVVTYLFHWPAKGIWIRSCLPRNLS